MADVRGLPHRAGFAGVVEAGTLQQQAGDLAIRDVAELDGSGAVGLPTDAAVDELVRRAREARPRRIVAVGDGALLDVAKRAWALLGDDTELLAVPAGAEAWRAFAPFTSLYDTSGTRVSRKEDLGAGIRVLIDPGILSARAELVTALQRADTMVQAVEVAIGTAAQSWDRALALAAIRLLSGVDDDPGSDVVAAGLTVSAFASPGLGLAHAAASRLGALSGRTHDVPNVVLGPKVARFWGDRVGWGAVAEAMGVAATAAAIAERLDGFRMRAGLPATLTEAGFAEDVRAQAALRALGSSGVPWFPSPVTAAELRLMLEL